MNFSQQAETWIQQLASRKKDPVQASTLRRYRDALDSHLMPAIGNLELEQVGNKAAKELVSGLKLAPATIGIVLYVLKAVVKSAVDEEGNQVYPRTWNSDFIDAPVVAGQKAPDLPLEALQTALGASQGQEQALYALLAGTGLRISEALSLRSGQDDGICNYWDAQAACLKIRTAKTAAGIRLVDLDPKLNTLMIQALPVSGLIFGGLCKLTLYRNRLNSRIGCRDFHRFRRFRLTHLDKQRVPDGLARYWTGHAARDVHESYIKVANDLEARKDWAIRAGLGFSL